MAQITSKNIALVDDTAELPQTKLSAFVHHRCDEHPDFEFSRHWYKGPENRVGVEPWLNKKIFPGEDGRFGCAAKCDLLVPPTAPGDLGRYGTLVDRFDDTLPPYEKHAMIHVKIMLDPAEAWHVGFERVRSYARAHFAHRFAAVLIAHVPGLVGLKGQGNHVHCAVLSREITINGFGGACTDLCSDRGYEAALAAWREHKKSWVDEAA
ncbi:MAG: hypothetical protein CL575_10910 [Altererythrobacter sp.]|nr:hypothetical protein [Altererythrobacter sp.]MBK63427.1 hypothetical protein [Altererythrobacter sp.]|tara:strand:- start:15946 stop:16572 length:627 start_codon:yes stop_codon:yes gene_type:complete